MKGRLSQFTYHSGKVMYTQRGTWPKQRKRLARLTLAYPLREDFRLTRYLGKGSYANVYEAETGILKTTNRVAIKVIRKCNNPNSVITEFTCLMNLRHQNIIHMYAAFFDDNPYIVMELAQGSLGQIHYKLISDVQKIKLLLGVLQGVEYIHQKWIIHLDLKPWNILLVNNKPKIADFGAAINVKGKLQQAGHQNEKIKLDRIKTSLIYCNSDGFDRLVSYESDMYSVGATFFEVLQGYNLIQTHEFKHIERINMEKFYRDAHKYGRLVEKRDPPYVTTTTTTMTLNTKVAGKDYVKIKPTRCYFTRRPVEAGLGWLREGAWVPVLQALMKYNDANNILSVRELLDHKILQDLQQSLITEDDNPNNTFCFRLHEPKLTGSIILTPPPLRTNLTSARIGEMAFDLYYSCNITMKSRDEYLLNGGESTREQNTKTEKKLPTTEPDSFRNIFGELVEKAMLSAPQHIRSSSSSSSSSSTINTTTITSSTRRMKVNKYGRPRKRRVERPGKAIHKIKYKKLDKNNKENKVSVGFPCKMCGKIFGSKCNVSRHRNLKHVLRFSTWYKCLLCDTSFTRSTNARQHKCYINATEVSSDDEGLPDADNDPGMRSHDSALDGDSSNSDSQSSPFLSCDKVSSDYRAYLRRKK